MVEGRSIGLVSCSKSKRHYPCNASEMYSPSSLFRKAYNYSLRNYSEVGILSAKYGFLLPEDLIEPYDITLNEMRRDRRRSWARRVLNQMHRRLNMEALALFYFHAGEKYRSYIVPRLRSMGKRVEIPLEGYRLGEQMRWYNEHVRGGR